MKRFLLIVLCFLMVSGTVLPAHSEETPEFIEIHTVQDLLSITDRPDGDYVLMQDLDMTGISWPSPDFSGTFDGNGHAILNLTLSQPGPSRPESYDGNLLSYETSYVGLFGAIQGAEVKNLSLLNVRGLIEMDSPCFLAGIAGYFQESTISNCTVTGILELRAHDRMFGVGGIAGFCGVGLIENCNVDVTLICTDTDAQTKDEQFLGGVYGTGYVDVKNCTVAIDGYVSDHGYVHNGGIVGMLMQAPFGWKYTGRITGNEVNGKITFFEDNLDRRAYCSPFVGEILSYSYAVTDNIQNFQRDERKEYDVELRPEMCENPAYDETVTVPGCDTFGYTTFTCTSCGYSYTDRYTLCQHTVTQWSTLQAATEEAEGLEEGSCDLCGHKSERIVPKLEPAPILPETLPTTEPEPTEPLVPEKAPFPLPVALIAGGVAVLLILILILIRPKQKKQGRFQK